MDLNILKSITEQVYPKFFISYAIICVDLRVGSIDRVIFLLCWAHWRYTWICFQLLQQLLQMLNFVKMQQLIIFHLLLQFEDMICQSKILIRNFYYLMLKFLQLVLFILQIMHHFLHINAKMANNLFVCLCLFFSLFIDKFAKIYINKFELFFYFVKKFKIYWQIRVGVIPNQVPKIILDLVQEYCQFLSTLCARRYNRLIFDKHLLFNTFVPLDNSKTQTVQLLCKLWVLDFEESNNGSKGGKMFRF